MWSVLIDSVLISNEYHIIIKFIGIKGIIIRWTSPFLSLKRQEKNASENVVY